MTQCKNCHSVFAEGDKCPVCGTSVKKGWLSSLFGGEGGGIGKFFKNLTIFTILFFILFLVLTEIAVFNFKNFFVNCSGFKISGFWINFLTFIVGLVITVMVMKRGIIARAIIVALLFSASFAIPVFVLPYCSGD